MAQHRLTYDFRRLLQARDQFATFLTNNGISVNANDTLEQLHIKAQQLVGKTAPTRRYWSPDPLWSNVKQMCLDDTRDFPYKAVYLMSAQDDTSEFLDGYGDAFETSDGVFYDGTIKPFTHTWNKSLDMIDSNGNPFRWIKLYSNTEVNIMPTFYDTVIWMYYDLANTIWYLNNTSSVPINSITSGFGTYQSYTLKAVELGFNVTKITTNPVRGAYNFAQDFRSAYGLEFLKANALTHITFNNGIIASSSNKKYIYFLNGCYSLYDVQLNNGLIEVGSYGGQNVNYCSKSMLTSMNSLSYLDLPSTLNEFDIGSSWNTTLFFYMKLNDVAILNTNNSVSNIKTFGAMNSLKKIEIGSTNPSVVVSMSQLQNAEEIIISDTISSFTASYLYRLETIQLPEGIISLNISCPNITVSNPFLKNIVLPSTLQSLTFSYFLGIETLTLPSGLLYAPILAGLYGLKNLNLPSGWIYSLNISNSKQFSREALRSIIDAYADMTGQTAPILNIGSVNSAKLTAEDLAVANSKNITIS